MYEMINVYSHTMLASLVTITKYLTYKEERFILAHSFGGSSLRLGGFIALDLWAR
jgi:hypothetical protein